jgi:hypothetical protein
LRPTGPNRTPIRTRSRLPIASACLAAAVLLVTLAVHYARRSSAPEKFVSSLATNWQAAIDPGTPTAAQRAVFPYSVVPGGVRDAQELRGAVAADPVVAEHYSGFRLAEARTIRLDRPTAMYVSYRIKNQVYWTKNRMLIPAGESLISDGEHLSRVRCGNRLSAMAAKPVSAAEPPREKLEAPESVPPLLAQLLPGDGGETFPPPVSALPDLPLSSGGPGSTGTPPSSFPPILPPGVLPPSNDNPAPPPPVVTPEPGSLLLLLGGAFLCATLTALLRK